MGGQLARIVVLLVAGTLVVGCRGGERRATDPTTAPPLQRGPIRHDSLPAEQVARLTRLQQIFAEVDPTPLAGWIDDFRRDQHPEREIAIYEAMARAYTGYCQGRDLDVAAKREVFSVVLTRSGAPDEEVLERLTQGELHTLTRDDVKAILALYDAPPAPITVTK